MGRVSSKIPDVSDLSGETIDGRYRLTRIVASGGMATIYAALDLRLDRQVAVKVMHPHLAQDEQFVKRFSETIEYSLRVVTFPLEMVLPSRI